MNAPTCKAGHPMVLTGRFRFDDEPTDSPEITMSLQALRAIGVELGAIVTLWECRACNEAEAFFDEEAG